MYRGKVTAVDAGGVYVQTADFGVIGPCQAVVANYAAGDMVLLSDVGSDAAPDLIVVGRLSAAGSASPGTSMSVSTLTVLVAAQGIELGSGGPTITSGTGAPTHSAPNGSTYHRTDGTASTTLYVRAAGAWSALS